MAQPSAYNRQYNFQSFQASSPADPLPAAQVDGEFNAVKATIDEVLNNLAIIQRDDTAIANNSVGFDQLKAEVSTGVNPATRWLTATAYLVGDVVFSTLKLYRCLVAHTSGTFSTDLASVYWVLLEDFTATANSAVSVTYDNSTSGLAAVEVQSAIDEIVDEKLSKAGGTMTGTIAMNGNAITMGTAKITGVGDGTAAQDVAAYGQITALSATYQPLDAQLTDIAGLAVTDGGFIVGDGANFVLETAGTARASLGLVIGTDVQAYDAQLATLAGISPAAGSLILGGGSAFAALTIGADDTVLRSNGTTASWVADASVQVLAKGTTATTWATSVAEETVMTYTVPANTMGTDGAIRVRWQGLYANGTGAGKTLRIRVKFGSTTLYDDTCSNVGSGENAPVDIDFTIVSNNSASAQRTNGKILINADTTSPVVGNGRLDNAGEDTISFRGAPSTEDTTGALALVITMQMSASDAALVITKDMHTVELL